MYSYIESYSTLIAHTDFNLISHKMCGMQLHCKYKGVVYPSVYCVLLSHLAVDLSPMESECNDSSNLHSYLSFLLYVQIFKVCGFVLIPHHNIDFLY